MLTQPLGASESLDLDLQVQNELMHRLGIRNADVRLVDGSSLLFRGTIIRDGILLYARDESFRVAFETRTPDEYFDYKPLADQVRRSLIANRHSGSSMLNREKIETLVLQLREFVKYLRRLAHTPAEEFVGDPDKIGSAKYYLVTAIETCIDICNHIIASKDLRAPVDYADVFRVMGENKIFPAEFVQTLVQMAGFRNRFVHVYGDVDDRRTHEFLQTNLADFDRFQDYILNYVDG